MTKRSLNTRLALTAVFTALPVAFSFAAVGQSATQASAQTAQPAQPAQPAKPAGRAPVQAKSQAEFQAYQTAIANTQNAEAMEKAAGDFAAKFPESDLRVLLYRAAMHSYQAAGNSSKMLDMGLKVLTIDRDDPEALIGVAQVQEERTSPTDLDRDERMNQAVANAQHALETIDIDLAVPAGSAPERVEAYKKYLRSTAYSIIGSIQYKREQYGDAETNLRKAIDADPGNPDAVVILRLALALDQDKKYPDALEQANRAVQLTKEDTDIGQVARNERNRLTAQLAKAGPGAAGANNSPVIAPSPNSPGNVSGNSSNGTPGDSPVPANPANPAPPNH